jgi:beta-mannosidase
VKEVPWAFRAVIDVDPGVRVLGRAELEFESIDTFAKVYLVSLLSRFDTPSKQPGPNRQNGKEILQADNHFRTWRVPIPTAELQAHNELLLVFTPPLEAAAEVTAKEGPYRGGSCNLGDRSRIGIRKAQYHARWDWGPELWCKWAWV